MPSVKKKQHDPVSAPMQCEETSLSCARMRQPPPPPPALGAPPPMRLLLAAAAAVARRSAYRSARCPTTDGGRPGTVDKKHCTMSTHSTLVQAGGMPKRRRKRVISLDRTRWRYTRVVPRRAYRRAFCRKSLMSWICFGCSTPAKAAAATSRHSVQPTQPSTAANR